MRSRFGLKDAVLLLSVFGIGVLVVLSMVQRDRQWNKLDAIERNQETQSSMLSRLEGRIDALGEQGIRVVENGGVIPGRLPAERDTSWALEGIPIAWQPARTYSTDPRASEEYKPGGEFVEVFEAQPKKLTPILGEDVYSRRIQDMVLERLAAYDPESLELKGEIAEAWQYDPQGMWVRIKLHERARFSDGVPVTADDVVFSFRDYLMNPELETESRRSIMTNFDAVEKLDSHAVEISFSKPGAFNLSAVLTMYVLPKHFYEQFTPKQINEASGLLMGSGPFKVKGLDPLNQWKKGDEVILVRNEQYWSFKPPLASLRYYAIDEDLALLTEFTNEKADMIRPTSKQFAEKRDDNTWAQRTYSLEWTNMRSGYSFIGWQCGERNGRLTPFHDRNVRLGMTLILDRSRIIEDIFEGIGEIATGPNNPPSPASDPSVIPWPYDPDEAQRLFAEAGWIDRDNDGVLENERGDEFEFEFTYFGGGAQIERLRKYLTDQCAAVGIRCVGRKVDWSMFDQISKTRDFDSLTLAWAPTAPESDPRQIWHSDSIQNQGHNFIQWRHPDQDRIIDAIDAELDYEKRMALFHELHQLIHDEQPYTFLRVSPWLRFVSKEFDNVQTYPKGLEQREWFVGDTPARGP